MHPLRRLRARMRIDPRWQPALPAARADDRQSDDRERLHALRGPGVHDRMSHRRDSPDELRRRGGHQSRHLHRLRHVRRELSLRCHPHGGGQIRQG